MKLDEVKVRRTRERLGLTLTMVAQRAGTSKNTVLSTEHGADIRPTTARKIAEALEVEIIDLIAGEAGAPKAQAPLFPNNAQERRVNLGMWEKHYRAAAAKKRAEFESLEARYADGDATPTDVAVLCDEAQSLYTQGIERFEGLSAADTEAARVLDALDELGVVASEITHKYTVLPESAQVIPIMESLQRRKAG